MSTLNQPLDIPLDAHPDNVKGDSPLLNDARELQKSIYGVWTKINQAKAVQDKQRLADTAQSAIERSLKSVEPRIQRLRENFLATDDRITDEILPKAPDAMAFEIRAHVKQNGATPFSTTAAFITRGDKRSAAAVLTAPPYLSGLDDKKHGVLMDMARRQFCPDDCAVLDQLKHAIDRGERSVKQLTDTVAPLIKEWRGEDDNMLKELEAHG